MIQRLSRGCSSFSNYGKGGGSVVAVDIWAAVEYQPPHAGIFGCDFQSGREEQGSVYETSRLLPERHPNIPGGRPKALQAQEITSSSPGELAHKQGNRWGLGSVQGWCLPLQGSKAF